MLLLLRDRGDLLEHFDVGQVVFLRRARQVAVFVHRGRRRAAQSLWSFAIVSLIWLSLGVLLLLILVVVDDLVMTEHLRLCAASCVRRW